MKRKNLRILLAEGESGEVASSLRLLHPESLGELALTIVASAATLFPTIRVVNPDVILLDLSLTLPEPLAIVRRVHQVAPEVPLIVIGDAKHNKYAVESLQEGALDYLLKGFIDPRTIERALHTALERNTREGLALLRDPVTGLYIRDGFLTLGTRSMETAMERHSTLVLLCARIKNLSEIRTEYGESAVESSLREVGKLLQGSLRRSDIVARIGDSQFGTLAVDAIEPSGPVLRQRLEKRLAALNRDMGPRRPLVVQMSAGFWSPEKAMLFPEFLDKVEAELRIAADLHEPKLELRDSAPRR
ncbi:MAG TPA: diguanylate cyclase [Candidatus Acidoferrum sp.]|nr:diguanylate cyclase [Candidatus Acidoferrum sp.]